ncbi:hypothetical protein B7494_g2592 [Chlorociboria aeruginascens]|nr:hypothetical protein B7494_g2592 [Chlorociboria aeruginascens]
MSEPKLMRKTRFVCISDTHNASPNSAFKLPQGDVLIHAGDLTNQGTYSELQKTIQWIEEADFEAKIVIAGNHDITLDTDFYSQYGLYFHNQDPQDPSKCQELLRSASILWLKHEQMRVTLRSPTGPRTTFKIFGSPLSPAKGMWAFGYGPDEGATIWNRIPLDTDIVVTHTPPKYHCDEAKERRAVGCEALRQSLWRVRPRLAICGHVHEGRGSERILWDLDDSKIKYKEKTIQRWEDPGFGNKKLSLVDLTAKGKAPLQNDGGVGDTTCPEKPLLATISDMIINEPDSAKFKGTAKTGILEVTTKLLAVPTESLPPATRGQGSALPLSQRCDLEALSGRFGRKETCVVNAAIMASSWPHGQGGKKFNKPVVVDIDLPVWD